jgi:hypothetical protein
VCHKNAAQHIRIGGTSQGALRLKDVSGKSHMIDQSQIVTAGVMGVSVMSWEQIT